MSPGCTYRSGECDENASWQCRAGGEDSFEDSTLDATATGPGASLRARVTTAAPPAAHRRCTTTITGTPMLVDQRRSRPGRHRVTVLGSFSVTAHGESVPLEAEARRVVAYLAVHRRPQRRTALAADLWPGVPAASAAALLAESLAGAGALLAEDAGDVDGSVELDPAVEVDLDEAMTLVRALAELPGHPDSVPADLPAAAALLSADVLPAWADAWLAVERERFRQIRLNALEELSSALTAAGRFTDAVTTARVAVRTNPSREGARRALIEAHLAQGEIAEAVAEYDEYLELLRSSVGGRTSGSEAAFGLEGLLPPAPAWPVLRRRPAERVPVAAPGLRAPRGQRRLISGGAVR
jgi:DNA-binding SARP family transcriptional activator